MPKKSGPNKSDFVRSQPLDLSAADVVAKAKEAGMTLAPVLVYKVRAKLQAKEAKKKKAAAPDHSAAPAPSAAKSTGDGLSASAFIRSLPSTMSVKEAAEKGAAAGYSFKPNYVYDVRNNDKKRKAKAARGAQPKAAAAAAVKPAPAKKLVSHAANSSSRAQFRRLMIDLGLSQAEELYADVHRELKAIRDRE